MKWGSRIVTMKVFSFVIIGWERGDKKWNLLWALMRAKAMRLGEGKKKAM